MTARLGVLYGRQSLTKGDSESVADQLERGRETAKQHGVEIVEEIFEPPSTGAFKDRGRARPRFPDVLEAIHEGRADCVIAYKTDRLSRGGGPGWAPIWEAAEAAGIEDLDRFILIVGHGWMSEFEIGIRATMDREESKKTSDRVTDAKARSAAAGRPNGGGRRAFGYAEDRVTIIEEEAAVIRDGVDRYLAGEGLRSIARGWNSAGIRTSTGVEWRAETIRHMFHNPRIAGLRGHADSTKRPAYRSPGRLAEPGYWRPKVVGKAVWEPIISAEKWEALQSQMTARMTGTGRPPTKHILTGLVYCCFCGYKLNAQPKAGRPAYCCAKRPGTTQCGRINIKADGTEELVIGMALHRLASPQFEAALEGREAVRADSVIDEILLLEAKLGTFARMFGNDEITHAEWAAMRSPVDAKLTAARAQLDRTDSGQALKGLIGAGSNIRALWDELAFDRQRAVLDAVYERIVINPARRGFNRFDPDRVEPTWRDRPRS